MTIFIYSSFVYVLICFLLLLNKPLRKVLFIGINDIFVNTISIDDIKGIKGWKNLFFTVCAVILFGTFYLIISLLMFFLIPIIAFILIKNGNWIESKKEKISIINQSINPKYLIQPPRFIYFRLDLPFKPLYNQIIYVENSYNGKANSFIEKHKNDINKQFSKRGCSLSYLPDIYKTIRLQEAIFYYCPQLTNQEFKLDDKDFTDNFYLNLLSYSRDGVTLNPGFLRYKGEEDGYYSFSYFELTEFEEDQLWEQIAAYISNIGDRNLLYSLGRPDPEDVADNAFPYEAKQLVKEIKERIEKLRLIGIGEMAIKSVLMTTPKLSRLLIDKDYRIFLPDYNNMEIKLYPLPKAIFFLFLKHPEGIIFKCLPDFKEELTDIYMKISNREKIDDVKKSINDVTDPTKNAINEKCSRIREAFIKEFDESLAQNYFITGDRSKPKLITLNREMVLWENDH